MEHHCQKAISKHSQWSRNPKKRPRDISINAEENERWHCRITSSTNANKQFRMMVVKVVEKCHELCRSFLVLLGLVQSTPWATQSSRPEQLAWTHTLESFPAQTSLPCVFLQVSYLSGGCLGPGFLNHQSVSAFAHGGCSVCFKFLDPSTLFRISTSQKHAGFHQKETCSQNLHHQKSRASWGKINIKESSKQKQNTNENVCWKWSRLP